MSPRWNRFVRLRLTPEVACATLEAGWRQPRVLSHSRRATEPPPSSAAASGDSRDSGRAIDTLVEGVFDDLSRVTALKGARLDVELADALVHLDVASGEFASDSERHLESVARACVAELLGDAAKDQEVRWQLQADARHLLICGVDRSLLQSLNDLAQRHGLRLRSVQPDFCLQWNRYAGALQNGSSVFAVASGDDAVIAHASQGTVRALSVGPWLDRFDAPGTSNVQTLRLLCDLGLAPVVTAAALDQRADRLLASVGCSPDAQHTFVLVAPASSAKAVTRRWTVVEREAERV